MPVEVFVSNALKHEGECHTTDDGEGIVQRYARGAEAAVNLAPQQNEKRRADAAGRVAGTMRASVVAGNPRAATFAATENPSRRAMTP